MKNTLAVSWVVGVLVFGSAMTLGGPLEASDFPLTGNVNIMFGDKYLSSADWAPVDNQEEVGNQVDLAQKEWPVYANFAYSQSKEYESGSFSDSEGTTHAFDVGVKKIWTAAGGFRPFVGTGLSLVRGEIKTGINVPGGEETTNGSDVGYWASGGFGYLLGERINVGAQLKWSSARLNCDNGDGTNVQIQAGGLHVGIFTGVHF